MDIPTGAAPGWSCRLQRAACGALLLLLRCEVSFNKELATHFQGWTSLCPFPKAPNP